MRYNDVKLAAPYLICNGIITELNKVFFTLWVLDMVSNVFLL